MTTEEKRSNEDACERSEVRTPAFWRVVNRKGEYFSCGDWSPSVTDATIYEKEAHALHDAKQLNAKVRPVKHSIVKKPKRHGIGWAVARLKEGKRVRRRGWDECYATLDPLMHSPVADVIDLMSTDWELAE